MQNNPTVTIAIPTYNEANHIESVIRGFLHQKYPTLLEMIVADGGSTDGTQKIVIEISLEDSRVKLLNNPLKIQSAGLNLILNQSQGDIFLRADAHTEYATNYLEKCVEALTHSKADNVGGSQRYVAKTSFQAGVALASKSWLTGVAKYRNPQYEGYADTVYLGCFWKHSLLKIADTNQGEAFDTTQVRNQDLELNLKLRETNSCAVYVSPSIKAWYFPRDNWNLLFSQYFKDGRGSYITAQKSPDNSPIRQKLPFLSLFILIFLWLIDLMIFHGHLYSTVLVGICTIIPFIEAFRVTTKFNSVFDSEIWKGTSFDRPNLLVRCFACLICLFTMPIAYAIGYAYQLIKNTVLRVQGW
jgi:glycosyltransferase involved in cell wall biosynthesis